MTHKFVQKKYKYLFYTNLNQMKTRNKILIINILAIVFVFLSSCSYKDKEKHSTDILNKKTFISMLIEIHKADALLNKESLFDNKLTNPDSLSYYNQIFKKYKTTREIFYNTIVYYLNNMEKFNEIQKTVTDSLTNRYKILDSLEKISLKKEDLWNLKRKWVLPDDGVTNAIPFNLKVSKNGEYTLSATIISYADDLSKDLKFKIIADYADSSFDKKELKLFTKNSQWKDYSLTLQTNPNKILTNIEGEVVSHSNTTTYMHIGIKDIMLTFKSQENIEKEDSLQLKSMQ